MKPILDLSQRPILQTFFAADTLLAFDYDGTLAPIVDQPSEARMRTATRALLARVARRYPVVVITGRARLDVLRFLHGVPLIDVVGNHGQEVFGAALPPAPQVEDWRRELGAQLADVPGIAIEDKRYSLSVHYRACADPDSARSRVHAAAAQLVGARLIGGKAVLNVVVDGAPDKGGALQRVRARLGAPAVVFVGDDDTDEDAFQSLHDPRALAIRVGARSDSAARYYIDNQDAIDTLLAAFERGSRSRPASSLHPPPI